MRFVTRWSSAVARRIAVIVRSFGAVVFVCGAMTGLCLLTCWHQLGAQLGWSWQVIVAGLAVVALTVERSLAFRPGRTAAPLTAMQASASLVASAMVLAAWTVGSLWAANGAAMMAGWYPVHLLSTTAGSLLFHVPAAMLLFAVPAWCAGRMPSQLAVLGQTSGEVMGEAAGAMAWGTFLSGIATGVFLDSLGAAPLMGMHLAGAVGTACAAGWLIFRTSRNRVAPAEGAEPVRTAPAATRMLPALRSRQPRLPVLLALAAIGAMIPAISRMTDQLMAVSNLMVNTWCAALVGGIAIGMRRSGKPVSDPARLSVRGAFLAAAWFAVVSAAFPLLLDLSLTLSALVGTAWLLMLARCLLTTLLALPLGIAAGSCLCAFSATPAPSNSGSPPSERGAGGVAPDARTLTCIPGGLTALATGIAVSHAVLVPSAGVRLTGIVAAFLLVLCALPLMARRKLWPATRRARLAFAAAALLIAASPWLARSYAPARAARILFSTNVFTARQVAVESRFLTALDETRLDRIVEGTRGTLTLWHARGAQAQVRSNGVPAGFVSTDPVVSPQYTADVLHPALPMTLHQSPHRVLILGSGAGAALLTALSFPAMQIECVDADKRLIPLLSGSVWPQDEFNPLNDDRVTTRTLEPALAVASRCGEWDVILSSPPQSALITAGAELTAGFYERCARRLTADGIFCQRFSHVDFGPEPILVLAKTMQQVFRDVAAVECAPGEMLLLGTNSESGLVRPGFVERLQASHVRRVLSNAGWDWCVPLNLAAYDHRSLAELSQSSGVNTASNGRLTCRLPWELVRWAPKWQETAQRLTPAATRLAAWNTVDGNDPDLLARLAEVSGQWKLMVANPDQPWVYRKTLRERLEKSTRSVIVQTGGAHREMHPEDKFRKDYFAALGAAARDGEPTGAELERLTGFLEPYDPLITYFAHHELAELYSRRQDVEPGVELRCRLHMAWYADPRDRSIRNIVRALDLLNREDAAGVDRVAQWDQINGLLQLLMSRWELRGRVPPPSTQIALNDLEKSLAAAEQSLTTLARIASEAGIAADDCGSRCTVLERSLVRPIETYRGRLIAHEADQARRNKVLMKKVEEATSEVQ